MAYLATKKKQPIEVLDYDIWYADNPDGSDPWLLDSDQISDVVITVSAPELKVAEVVFANRVKLWVSEGVDGKTYVVSITITTQGGRVKQDEIRFRVKDI